ncbi:MAG: metalloregulator ArsR/SmtB family transcription factor [Erysipelotrichaceae bacterium]|nr:metalloregulator ArsR/SmtB family transcription factor [Erysipelotrichaceae bacterium]
MSELPNEKILDAMQDLLAVASDSTRLKILYAISGEEHNVSEIVSLVGASQSLVSHQLEVLRRHRLVSTRKEGRKVYYLLCDDHVQKLIEVVYRHVTEKTDHE